MFPELYLYLNLSSSSVGHKKIDTTTFRGSITNNELYYRDSKYENTIPRISAIPRNNMNIISDMANAIFIDLKDLSEEENKSYYDFLLSASEVISKVI